MLLFNTKLDGVLWMTREQFDADKKEPKILYVVDEADGFSLYLGNKALLLGKQIISELTASLDPIERLLGLKSYHFPDIYGSGKLDERVLLRMDEFILALYEGEYAEFHTLAEQWAAYASEKGLRPIPPDVNGDGKIDSDDARLISDFIAASKAGVYPNNADGFQAFMREEDGAILGNGLAGFRLVTQEAYSKMQKKKPDIVYFIRSQSGFRMYIGDSPVSGGGAVAGVMTREYPGASGTYGNMEWVEEVHSEEA